MPAEVLDAVTRAGYRIAMVERLAITRLGSRGDGVADTEAGPLYVPYALPGKPPRSSPGWATPIAAISPSSTLRAPTALRRSARISEFAAVARFNIWRLRAIAIGNVLWSLRPWRELGSMHRLMS